MRVLFYVDRVMHYQVATFKELENRIGKQGGEFILVSGRKHENETGRVAISDTIIRQHMVIPYSEWICGTYTFRFQPTLQSLIQRITPDIVIVMGHVGSLTYWRLGKLAKEVGFKYVTWQCGFEYNSSRLKHKLMKRFFNLFDYHLAYNTNAKRYLLANGVADSRITVIHNTINEQDIIPRPRIEARRMVIEELKLPPERPIILYVGAILAEKRLELLIDAVRQLAPRIAVSLVIVGDGPALEGLKAATTDLDYVRYTGRVVSGVGRFFDSADVFVLPGTGGLAINEAMAHGLPVISAFADGSAEDLIIDGLNGYVLKESTSEEIAESIETVLNPDVRPKMGTTSRHLITTKYSFRAFIDHVLEGLHKAVHGKRLTQC